MYVHCSTSGSGWVVLRRLGVGAVSAFSAALLVLRLRGVGGVSSSVPVAAVDRRLLLLGGVSSADCAEAVSYTHLTLPTNREV